MAGSPRSAVPLESLGVDANDPGFYARRDHHDVLARLRSEAPLFEYAPGSRTVARYEDIREVSRDTERFCASRGVLVNDPVRSGGPRTKAPSILQMDPPEHAEYRKLVSRSFTPRAVARMENRLRSVARSILDRVDGGTSEIDFVDEVAAPFPMLVIADLLGVPERDRGSFRRWSDSTIESPDRPVEETVGDVGELIRFLRGHIDEKRRRPGEDLVSVLVASQVSGRPLTGDEVLVFCMALLVAGNETTRHLLSGAVHVLWQHPDQRAMLVADPSLLPSAVEECLRWVTPVKALARTAVFDTEVGASWVNEGDYLVLLYASGNRDESVFGPTAGEFDLLRPPRPGHVAFGFGEHLCLGAALARLEAAVMLGELLRRYPRYEVTGDPAWVRSTLVGGMSRLPVAL